MKVKNYVIQFRGYRKRCTLHEEMEESVQNKLKAQRSGFQFERRNDRDDMKFSAGPYGMDGNGMSEIDFDDGPIAQLARAHD